MTFYILFLRLKLNLNNYLKMDDIYRRHGHLESHFLNDPSMSFLKDEEIIALAY